MTKPLAVRMRPTSIDEVVGQEKITNKDSAFRSFFEEDSKNLPAGSIMLFGPPGTGKTTLAYLLARQSNRIFKELSAVSASVKDVRNVVDQAKKDLLSTGKETVLFIDEVHRFSKSQQDVLLPSVENRFIILVAATTENPSFSIISPLLSRSIVIKLEKLDAAGITKIIDRALVDERGLKDEFELTDKAKEFIVANSGGDARKALVILEAGCESKSAGSAGGGGNAHSRSSKNKKIILDAEDFENIIEDAFLDYDKNGDKHYDTISAFIKSVRGSDVDAALHYLARLLVSGEDPRFIARRLMISASEDVGMADPSALQTAVAAAQSVQLVGMPEARIILAEATVHLATAPKSNKAYMAIEKAISDVKKNKNLSIPNYLRDGMSSSADDYEGYKNKENSAKYKYAHDYKFAIAPQNYLPKELRGKRYYEPSDRGYERQIANRLRAVRKLLEKNQKDIGSA